MAYKHGTYGELTASKVKGTANTDTVVVYVGTAPINLIRGYASANLVNVPIKVANMVDAQSKIGYSSDWDAFSLCEAFAEHYDNTIGNVGPIYIINVLDPAKHKKKDATTVSVAFSAGRGEFASDKIILDTIAIADKVEGVDFEVSYNYAAGKVVITSLNDSDRLNGDITVSYEEVDTTAVEAADVIGQKTSAGAYSGLSAIHLLYQKENVVANIVAAPGWSHLPEVYTAMVSAASKINGHWDAFVVADIPLVDDDTTVDTIAKAIAWKAEHGYTSEFSKVCWPMVKDGTGRKFHLSTVAAATMQRVDSEHDGVPFESPSNKQIMATGQFFGDTSKNMGYDQHTANDLNEKGITTAVYWGGQWVLWGPHTAAFISGGSMDARGIFDVSIRMLMHITNGFQLRNGTRIDEPMNLNERDAIVNSEQEILDSYAGMGALIGQPEILFVESENPEGNLINGDFVWSINVTPTVPFKSGTARVTYTDEGFQAYFGGEA